MKRLAFPLVLGAAMACAAKTSPAPATQDSSRSYRVVTGVETTLVRMVGPAMERPASGPQALAKWRPDILPIDSGGECNLSRTMGSGATTVSAAFPSLGNAHTSVHLSFDSAGRLIRFSERRGGMHNLRVGPELTARQRDSVLIANIDAKRSTTISMDFAMDNALAMNRGGGIASNSVHGTVRDVENLEQFGPPKARIARVRRLCGV